MSGGQESTNGRPVDHAIVSVSVPEMDCASCAGKVENSLKRVEGVLATELNPTSGTVRVTYRVDTTTEETIIAAIENAGYQVHHRSNGTHSDEILHPSAVWTSPRALKTWIGAVLLLIALGLEFILFSWNTTVISTQLYIFTIADTVFIGAIIASGIPIVRNGYYSAKHRSLDIHLLMGTAIIAASAIGLFIEAATLAVLFSIAELLERYAMDQTRDSLRELLELAPHEARVMQDGEERMIPVEDVEVGYHIAVHPGEKIPVDGVVHAGNSAVDQAPITGESVPIDKTPGDEVFAGTINQAGYLDIQATAVSSESTLSHIIRLVRDAQSKKTDQEQFVDRFAAYYTPIVVVLAVLTVVFPPLLIDGSANIGIAGFSHTFVDDWRTWFIRGLTLLVIACPCAFVISTPVSVASGVTSAARNGVLIKGGNYLEAMGEIDAIAFDKTGTLTKGESTVTDVIPLGHATESTVLQYAGSVEQYSEHPIAAAILDLVKQRDVDLLEISGYETIPGKGVQARIAEETYLAGKPEFLVENGSSFHQSTYTADGGTLRSTNDDPHHGVEDVINRLEEEGKTIVFVGTKEELFGILGIADEIRLEAKRTVETLHSLGVAPLVMLTGDNEGTARAVAIELGLDDYQAGLLPEEKVSAIEELTETCGSVAMVGDGINDALRWREHQLALRWERLAQIRPLRRPISR